MKTKRITYYAVLLALILVGMTLDRMLSFWNVVSFAIVAVATTAVFATLYDKPLDAFLSGLFFGFASFVTAFPFGKETFYNPLVSILPRAFIGLTGYGVYRLVRLLLCKMKSARAKEYIALSFGGAFTALSNTIYTLTCMWLFAQGSPLFVAFATAFVTNVLPEMLIATLLTPLLVLGVRRGLRI